ncbi:MAG: peptide deformylase [Bacilli bacterium]|jgi:peptide deformylase|nr:peptide deformylase [Bacilli bacterium]
MLTYKDIIKENDPNLRKNSKDVVLPLSEEDKTVMNELHEYLLNGYDIVACEQYDIRPGVGIAAPQISVLKKMFCILGFDETGQLHQYGVINPKIISHSEELTYIEAGEGCLSVDRDTQGYVHRPKRITARCYLYDFDTLEVKEATLRLRGYMAIVFQHEHDHLHGKLFVDHLNPEAPFYVPENSTPIRFKMNDEQENTKTNV